MKILYFYFALFLLSACSESQMEMNNQLCESIEEQINILNNFHTYKFYNFIIAEEDCALYNQHHIVSIKEVAKFNQRWLSKSNDDYKFVNDSFLKDYLLFLHQQCPDEIVKIINDNLKINMLNRIPLTSPCQRKYVFYICLLASGEVMSYHSMHFSGPPC
jgi:hypothetical protein